MSEKVPLGTIATVAIAGGSVAGAVFLGYKYFVEPGSLVLAQYRFILTDIYKETKKFLEDNAALDPPIYGLTTVQEEILKAKESALERIRPEVERILETRNIDVSDWFYSVLQVVIVVLIAPVAVDVIRTLLKNWKQKPESANIQSSHGHAYVLYEILTNEMAELGKLNIASGFLADMANHYGTYTEPLLNVGISYYNALIPTLIPGTLAYIVATSMLTYMTTEVSATMGIMGVLWNFWLPPLI